MTSSFLQISPSVNVDFILYKINITEDYFLKLVALYFLSYAILQIPCGFILDSKGFEKLFPISTFIVFIGCILYWLSSNILLIGLSRLIIGAGCSTAYIISIFIATKYFDKSIIPLLIALTEIASGLGDYFAENIYLSTIKLYGWDTSNLITIFIIFSLFIYSLLLTYFIKKNSKESLSINIISGNKLLKNIIKLIKSPGNLWIFAYSFFTWGIIMAFAGYWAKEYYIIMHHYKKNDALFFPEIYWISFSIAALIIGSIVKNIDQAKKFILILSVLGVIAYIIMLTPILFGYSFLIFITILTGISSSGVVISFFIIQYFVEEYEKGIAISMNNFFIVVGGMVGQISFSYIKSFNFDKIFNLGVNINPYFYSGISMLALWSFFALITTLFLIKKIGSI